MLRDELAEIREENSENLEERIGECKYCGQTMHMELPVTWDKEKANEIVAESCDCLEAEMYARDKEQRERVKKAIEEQFGQQAGAGVIEFLKKTVNMIVDGDIASTTVDIGNGLKSKISITGKGLVKVERSKTEKETREA